MVAEPIQWTDRSGVMHRLRSLEEIPETDAQQCINICRQFQYMHILLVAGSAAPALERARPTLISMMLRYLLPDLDAELIAAISNAEGEALLVQWCACQEGLAVLGIG